MNLGEARFKVDFINDESEKISNELIDSLKIYIEKYRDRINDGYEWDLPPSFYEDNKLLGMHRINFELKYTFSKENKLNGSFKRVEKSGNYSDRYNVFIKLTFAINKEITEFRELLDDIISHELHHAYRKIKTIDKQTKADKLNIAKNNARGFGRINKNLTEFLQAVYLSLEPEVEARAQEIARQLERYKITNSFDDTFNYLKQFQPILDAKKLIHFNMDILDNLTDEEFQDFIIKFNKSLVNEGLTRYIKKDRESFYRFWKKRFYDSGSTLIKKINKMVADKHYLTEEKFINEITMSYLYEVYGIVNFPLIF